LAMAAILSAGPTRIGTMIPLSAAATAPDNALASHGCATAVGIGAKPLHLSSNRSYFPVPGCGFISHLLKIRRPRRCCCGRRAMDSNKRVEVVKNAGTDQCGADAQEEEKRGRVIP